ncbi:efflux RND transporter periplasmic adaptor subunit [Vibrio marisflavi]|uniref:p-hydroxybenzoic acid efflux pump subunit AaeA n=1 Tax=Vibrio marisflavi CECT 7928 TaxID=634439 RepID=A0ABM9A2M2_9VIBR|nr:efflux RND transporter periplasmic adaptor subunit [Vibrio marisflavi]CAH0538725.1 p-hydroxybenzoic acid efflux pump subunit AaeA [Vibrio marisflavi CECT 7928]
MILSRIGGLFSSRPWLVSIVIVVLLGLWLGLGSLKSEEILKQPQPVSNKAPLAKVVYQSFQAQPTFKVLELYGRTAPNKQAKISAEYPGSVVGLKVKKGDSVKKGQVIAQIDKADLAIQLAKAKAMLKVREKEFIASKSLRNRGLQGEVAFFTAEAALVDAKADMESAKRNLANTEVRAPFDGVVDDLPVELGDYVAIGDPVAHLIDINPLVIEADVSERYIQFIKPKLQARVTFVDGSKVSGFVRYVSKVSSTSTNTFPVDIEVDNHAQKIPAGVSSEVELNLVQTPAIKITPAMLALDKDGNLGVKILKNSHVQFVPIDLVKAEQDGVWLAGLGDSADIITVGQGFVRDGDAVIAVKSDSIKP